MLCFPISLFEKRSKQKSFQKYCCFFFGKPIIFEKQSCHSFFPKSLEQFLKEKQIELISLLAEVFALNLENIADRRNKFTIQNRIFAKQTSALGGKLEIVENPI